MKEGRKNTKEFRNKVRDTVKGAEDIWAGALRICVHLSGFLRAPYVFLRDPSC
jgi:hypothetical protein